MREHALGMVVGALIACTLFFVARRLLRLACAMKRLRDAASRRDVVGETACSVCKSARAATGPVFQMSAVGMPSQGMPERIKVMLPMCPECHIRFLRFDFRCTLVSVGWCVAFLAVLAVLLYMPDVLSTLSTDLKCASFVVYAVVPVALRLYLVMPRYYKDIIGLPPIAKMVKKGYSITSRDRRGNAVESCDWVELVGDLAKPAATTGPQRLDDHVYAVTPRSEGLGRGIIIMILLLAMALAVGPSIVKLVNGGFHVEQDIIFGNAVPVSGHAWIILVNLFLALILMPIICDRVAGTPRRMPRVREAMWLLLAAYAAYALHLIDAHLYWGAGMSMYAATRGFVMARFVPFMVVFVALTGLMSFLFFALNVKEAREARKQGRTPKPLKGVVAAVFRVGLWWTILSLALFELHIAIWFTISNSMANKQTQRCDKVCFPQYCFSTNITTVAYRKIIKETIG